MPWLLLASQLMLSLLLFVAATGKVLRQEQFVAALRLSHVPRVLIGPLRVVVPAMEFGLAMALLLTQASWLLVTYAATACLLAVFTLWMAWVHHQGLHIRCGCFGSGEMVVGRRSIARNLLLLLIALGGLVLTTQTTTPLQAPTVWMVVTVTALSVVLALLRGLQDAFPGLALTLDRLEQLSAED